MDILEILKTTFTNNAIIGAIFSSITIILLGFYLRKKNVLTENASQILTKVVLSAAIPALALKAFLVDINQQKLQEGMNLLIWGFAIYVILIFATKLIYSKKSGDEKEVLEVLTTFGSTTFFGTPIVAAVYGPEGVMYASIFNIAYRVFLYSYGYIKMSGTKIEKSNYASSIKDMFLNPIIIATFLGLIIWLTQTYMPQVDVVNAAGEHVKAGILRIDLTLPWLYQPLDYLSKLCSPLAWLAIGAKLATISFKDAMADKTSWIYSLNKVILVPIINIVLLAILTVTNILPVSFTGLAVVVIMMAAPTATVAAAYAISFDKKALMTSNCSLLSTITAVVMMPIWIVILEVIKSIGIF